MIECTYSFEGMTLVLVLDPRNPEYNAFTVKAAPSGDSTFLKFGGTHSCALITYIGSKPGEVANVFISQRTGDVLTEHDMACAK
ncbi:hypothetical protein [Anaeromyxobacter oryzae]|uniref:hypothetical protein n=1 Tax=Anaeromyxobacter oryzae TaxID=2918170 RepID=UPI0020BDC575|nr:hypothetical protein [Anaeromyxobacter oryzae]